MKGKEIERKFLIDPSYIEANRAVLPLTAEEAVSSSRPCCLIEQAYLCAAPVLRVRRETWWVTDPEMDEPAAAGSSRCILTVKNGGGMVHDEMNLPMPAGSYETLLQKREGQVLRKIRYRIPLSDGLTVELDRFLDQWDGRIVAEVEFPDPDRALSFTAPDWFAQEVTGLREYRNVWMCMHSSECQT